MSLVFVQRFGFLMEGRLRKDGDRGEDLMVFAMLRCECRRLASVVSQFEFRLTTSLRSFSQL